MKKKIAAICGAVILAAIGIGCFARAVQPLPMDGYLYFDSDVEISQSKAYQYALTNNRLKEIRVDGYDNISNIVPANNGFYCLGLSGQNRALHVLYCENEQAKAVLPVEHLVSHESQRRMDHFFAYGQGLIFRLPGTNHDAVFYYADFGAGTIEPLEATRGCGSFAAVQKDVLYFSDLKGQVFCLDDSGAKLLFVGYSPVFADENTILYSARAEGEQKTILMQYDLGSGTSVPSQLHYELLKYHSGTEYEGSRLVVDGWLVGYQPGLLQEWHVKGTGKTTLVHLATGKQTVPLKLLWRSAEHLAYSERELSH